MNDETSDLLEIVDAHIMQQGMVAIRLKDGHAFFFTDVTLRQLLEKAEKSETRRCMVFIPDSKPS